MYLRPKPCAFLTQKIRVDIGSRVILSTKIHRSILKVKF